MRPADKGLSRNSDKPYLGGHVVHIDYVWFKNPEKPFGMLLKGILEIWPSFMEILKQGLQGPGRFLIINECCRPDRASGCA
jgi:hypothetical protein